MPRNSPDTRALRYKIIVPPLDLLSLVRPANELQDYDERRSTIQSRRPCPCSAAIPPSPTTSNPFS